MDVDICPVELKGLNWIEYSLIQLIRPVKNMFNLRDIGSRKTGVSATRGALVLLPVPIQNSLIHVSETLPSAANLMIMVDSPAGTKLVSLPRVLRALRWLKANNHLYKNIVIDEHFTFKPDDDIRFLNKSRNAKIEDLITDKENDPYLLTQKEVEMQPVVNNKNLAPDGTSFEQYVLVNLINLMIYFILFIYRKKILMNHFQ